MSAASSFRGFETIVDAGDGVDVLELRGGDTPRLEPTKPGRPSTVAVPSRSRLSKLRPELPTLTEAWMNTPWVSQLPSSVQSGNTMPRSYAQAAAPPCKLLTARASTAGSATRRRADAVTPRRLEPVAAVPAVDPAMLPAAGTRGKARYPHVRLFPHAPNQQSIIDQIVFGRDMDQSGEDQVDEEFIVMFNGCAGKPSWEPVDAHGSGRTASQDQTAPGLPLCADELARHRGKHKMKGVPAAQSVVDKVVFGAANTEDEAHKDFWDLYSREVAGRPSWKEQTRALRQLEAPPGKRAPGESDTRNKRGQSSKPRKARIARPRPKVSSVLPQVPATGLSAEVEGGMLPRG